MFLSDQSKSGRPRFVIEPLDARRLLSVTVAADEEAPTDSSETSEIVEATASDAVVEEDAVLFSSEEVLDPAILQTEILTLEEPVENLEDAPSTDDENLIRYTMMPAENERDVAILTLEEPTDGDGANVFHPLNDAEEVVDDPNVILYMTGAETPVDDSTQVEILTTSGEAPNDQLPPPPAKIAAAPGAADRSLFDSVIDSSTGSVLG